MFKKFTRVAVIDDQNMVRTIPPYSRKAIQSALSIHASGNVGYSCTTDVVPQSQSAADKASVQAAAAAAQAYCSANNGATPPGFVPVGVGPAVGPKQ